MKFDAMCRIAETHMKSIEPYLRMAALVHVPGPIQEYSRNQLHDGFRTIWDVVCIECEEMCAMIMRIGRCTNVAGQDGQFKIYPDYDRSQRVGSSTVGLEVGDSLKVVIAADLLSLHEFNMVFTGEEGTFWRVTGINHVSRDAGKEVIDYGSSEWPSLVRSLAHLAMYACSVCADIARPGRWVLRRVCSKPRDANASKKIPRSHQRDHWLSITDEERVRYFRSDDREPTGRHPIAHARRAHYRHIGENDDGTKKYTWVRACWVGSTEAEIRGQKYRVELEL